MSENQICSVLMLNNLKNNKHSIKDNTFDFIVNEAIKDIEYLKSQEQELEIYKMALRLAIKDNARCPMDRRNTCVKGCGCTECSIDYYLHRAEREVGKWKV